MIDLEINGKILKEIDLIIFDKDGTLFEPLSLLDGRSPETCGKYLSRNACQ